MKKLASITLSLLLSAGAALADSPKDAPKDAAEPFRTAQPAKSVAAKTGSEIAAEVDELRQTLQSQQKILQVQQEELQILKEELAKRDKQIEETRGIAAPVNTRASEAAVKIGEFAATSVEVKFTTPALNSTASSLAASNPAIVNTSVPANPHSQPANEEKGPTTIRFKGVSITPGGFVGADTVNRQHAESADVGTPFNWIPYAGNSTGHLTEMNFSARQSRLCLLFGAKAGSTTLSGYYEADFLGAGTTSNNRQTNSYVFRQRQLWGQAALANGLTFSGGQMWSLATEDRKGIALRQESLPVMIDPNYVVGFTWQRATLSASLKPSTTRLQSRWPSKDRRPPSEAADSAPTPILRPRASSPLIRISSSMLRESAADSSTPSILPDTPSTNFLTSSLRWQWTPALATTNYSESSPTFAIASIPARWPEPRRRIFRLPRIQPSSPVTVPQHRMRPLPTAIRRWEAALALAPRRLYWPSDLMLDLRS
jgi:hypothetical protein